MFLKTGASSVFLLLTVFSAIHHCESVSTRIYFTRCAFAGFTCVQLQGKYNITYQCPAGTNDVTFLLWQFQAPKTIEDFTITNCTTVRLSFQCTNENKPISNFIVANITNLVLMKSVLTHNPPTITFENIKNIVNIPENTFSQIKLKSYKPGCINPVRDFQNLYFKNVNISMISPGAFNELKDFHKFYWKQVKVERIQHLGVNVELNNTEGDFIVEKSNLEVLEHLAFKIEGKNASFVENSFIDVSPGAINGTIEKFGFIANKVNNLQPYAISILSQHVQIFDNRFEYLKAGAFEKIAPGLYQSYQRSFGNLKFTYEFSHNNINFMDAGCLNPDIPAYDNVATDLNFNRNALECSCENIGWLLSSGVGHGYNTALLEDFYQQIIANEHKNFCGYTSCQLNLEQATRLVKNGKCSENVTAESLCGEEKLAKENGIVVKPKNLEVSTVKPKKLAFMINGGIGIQKFLFVTLVMTSFTLIFN